MKKPHHYLSPDNYLKALIRLQKSIRSGQFARYTQQKKRQIWNRLCRYARQLGIKIKAPVATACLAAGLSFATPAAAQTFTLQTGADNPFNLAVFGAHPVPTFVDIDGDGDLDVFIGDTYGMIRYYENTGTATAPVFVERTGAANPFDGVDVGYHSAPAFVDIDGDGDKDAFIGEDYGTISFYKNIGTAATPVFVLQTGAANPFDGVDFGRLPNPAFVDIDKDGDMDVFIGTANNSIRYYKNIGTASAAIFVEQTGTDNPWDGIFVTNAAVAFVDIDGDGDFDVFTGQYYGGVNYYKNTGTAFAPVFTRQLGTDNPFNGVYTPYYSTPSFEDIDGDGDMDAFVGSSDGTIRYFKNNAITLPLHLLSFSGSRQASYNLLQWHTAGEMNTKLFELEMSSDGRNFVKIATINAAGNANNNYSFIDKGVYNNKVFYRLKMVDADGRFTYSDVIWINSAQAGGVSIYPNPVKDVLNINIGNAKILKTNAGIYDANGSLLQNILINSNQQQINVQRFVKGVYVIKFEDGTIQSFIKE